MRASTGDTAGRAGADLSAHPGIDRLSFTGSGAGAPRFSPLRSTAAQADGSGAWRQGRNDRLRRRGHGICRRLGARGHFPLLGQVCSATSRLLVEETAYDAFVEAVVARASTIRMGHPLDDRTQMGPVVSAAQRVKVWPP